MKKLVFTIICFSFLSCTSRQVVHVFNQGYTPEEIGKVVHVIDGLGFDARLNHLEIPNQLSRTSIIYPPIVQRLSTIDTMRDSLSEIGFNDIELIYETQGEHYYSTENIGLYLLNPNYVRPVENDRSEESYPGPRLSRIYYSDCDSIEAELSLLPQGTAILEIYVWNERIDREQTQLIDGEWSITDNNIVFDLFDEGSIEFDFSEFSGRDDYGRYYGIHLEIEYNSTNLLSCDYRYISYGSRESFNRI